ncbi:MAG: (2Fe-2S)-binding protein [Gammaproteobacteria bacterium]|nr:(2Fe-2S)-binding protein [Gammaproteobacteria bacterium]
MNRAITVRVNGTLHHETVDHRLLLSDFLRETLGLTGTHVGCGYEGRCGVCTVVYEGVAIKSCLMLAVQADGAAVLSVEGLARGEELHPLQRAMHDCHGLQCGFCTPGFLLTMYEFLKTPVSDPNTIRAAMNGVLCRCTGYVHIVAAVEQAARELAQMDPDERARWFPL